MLIWTSVVRSATSLGGNKKLQRIETSSDHPRLLSKGLLRPAAIRRRSRNNISGGARRSCPQPHLLSTAHRWSTAGAVAEAGRGGSNWSFTCMLSLLLRGRPGHIVGYLGTDPTVGRLGICKRGNSGHGPENRPQCQKKKRSSGVFFFNRNSIWLTAHVKSTFLVLRRSVPRTVSPQRTHKKRATAPAVCTSLCGFLRRTSSSMFV